MAKNTFVVEVTFNLTCFLYQICLTGKSYESDCFYVRNIKKPVKHL